MKTFGFLIIAVLHLTYIGNAHSKHDHKAIAFLQSFSRHVTQHDKHHKQCIHTTDLADKHFKLWRNWNRTWRWPQLAARDYLKTKPKAGATSIIRISWYLYEDSTNEIEADNFGRVGSFGARYDMGPYETNAFWLKPQQMNEVQRLLRHLPPSQKVLNWRDVLFVSGRKNNRWIVRMYSRKHKPKVVQQLLQIIMLKTLEKPYQP